MSGDMTREAAIWKRRFDALSVVMIDGFALSLSGDADTVEMTVDLYDGHGDRTLEDSGWDGAVDKLANLLCEHTDWEMNIQSIPDDSPK